MIDICRLSAAEIARRVRAGELSALAAVEAHIARIEAVNGKLNAVVVKRYDDARAEARDIDRRRAAGEALPPLAGVPVTIKECLNLKGTPSTFGLQTRAGHRADVDDLHVARLRKAGAIVIAKTNVSQILLFAETDNPLYGRTNNPWDVDRSCGGSSGGEGAIIAAGGSSLGIGTDIGGSARIPAAFCGIASLRPTAGRCVDTGRFSMSVGQRAVVSQIGCLARRVEDVALGIEVINDGRAPVAEPPRPLGDWWAVDLARLRIAMVEDDGNFRPSPACRRAVREAADMLRAAGATVVPWRLPDVEAAISLFFGLMSGDGGRGMKRLVRGGKVDGRIRQLTMLAGMPRWLLGALGGLLRALGQRRLAQGMAPFGHRDGDTYWRRTEAQIDYIARFGAALDSGDGAPFDLVLMPAHATSAVRHGATLQLPLPGAYNLLAPLTGYPAGVVPVTRVRADEESDRPKSGDVVERTAMASEQGSAGLPVGVQLMARPWREHVALAAMHAIETAARKSADYPDAPPL